MTSIPTNEEQFLLQLINRAREDPYAEMQRVLAHPDNQGGINFFNVDTALALSQVQGLGAEAPLAWNGDLADSADWQANDMIAKNYFGHQYQPTADPATWGPDLGARVTAEGYVWSSLGENLGRGVSSLEESHGQLYIDWGFTPTGIQNPPGHRDSMLNGGFREIGITYTTTPSTAAPLYGNVTVHNFGNGVTDYQIVGVAIDDTDNDDFYDIGEGLGGIMVTAVGGGNTYTTTTWGSGGYALPVAPNVTYTVTYSGAALGADQTHTVAVGTNNVAQDVEKGGSGTGGGNTPTTGDDTLSGTTGPDNINALAGNDSVDGSDGNDTLNGGPGNDTLNGGLGDDSLDGGGGSDNINGNEGHDTIRASFGDDPVVTGGPGDDFIYGGGGNDHLSGDDGNDTLVGDSNNDTLLGGAGDDNLLGVIGKDYLDGGTGNDSIAGANAQDTLIGGAGDDTLLGQGMEDSMDGGTGNDYMSGGASADTLNGGADNDTMLGGAFNDLMYGDAGDDDMDGGTGRDMMFGGDGNDLMNGHSSNDTMDGGAGDDTMMGFIGSDVMNGGAGNDLLQGENANDTLDGGAGFDVIIGGSGSDVINVAGNEGGDTISGGAGADTFIFHDFFGTTTPAGVLTTITDFSSGQDTIDISDVQFMTDLTAINVTDDGTSTTLDFGFGDVVVLENWIGTLQAGDFNFWAPA